MVTGQEEVYAGPQGDSRDIQREADGRELRTAFARTLQTEVTERGKGGTLQPPYALGEQLQKA